MESLTAVLKTTQYSLNNWADELKGISSFITKDDQVQVLVKSVVKKNNKENVHKLNKILNQLKNTHKFLELSIISKNMIYLAKFDYSKKVGSKRYF